MSHNEFEAIMKRITKACTTVYQAEVSSFYNISPASAELLRKVEADLEEAAYEMVEL